MHAADLSPPSLLHLHIAVLAKILQQVTALEILVGMDDGIELVRRHDALVLCLLDLGLVYVLEDAASWLVKISNCAC